jgi:lysyl-tRNA synthetase class 1
MSETRQAERHWADRAAAEVLARGVRAPVVSTGISPSGAFHVGHLREIVTGDAVARALRDAGAPARLTFVVDNLDPLRRIYPFLPRERFAPLVGRSLAELPAPSGEGRYDQHFLGPFLDALERLRVDVEVVPADELYASGRMNDVVLAALEQRDTVARILEEVTGKQVAESWSPWNPRCRQCRRLDKGVVLGFDRTAATVRSRCEACGAATEQPIAGGGKLTWRIDWPARWAALGVDVEPFGKDHASRGGSYDSGERLAREVFGVEPPHPIIYEWIALKGQGDMSSSRGNVLSIEDMLQVVPPEVLRYLVIKARPARSIGFDPGRPLARLVDEVDDAHARGRDDRALELSRAAGFAPVGVPFHHLVLVAQLGEFDLDRVMDLLARGGYRELDRDAVAARMELARGWLERFAPEDERVEVPDTLPDTARELAPDQRTFLARLAEQLLPETDAEQIHELIQALARADDGPGAKRGYEAIYRALLGRDRGPRAAGFIAALGTDRVAARFAEAAQQGP